MELPTSAKPGLIAGLLAGAGVLAASDLAQMALQIPTSTELVWDAAVGIVPGPLFSVILDSLKYAAKPLFFLSLLVVQVIVSGVLGLIYAVGSRSNTSLASYSRRRPWIAGIAYGLGLCAVASGALLWTAIADPAAWALAMASLLAVAVLQSQLLARFEHAPSGDVRPAGVDLARRSLLVKGTAAVIVLALGAELVRTLGSLGQGGISLARSSAARLRSYITSNEDFYKVSKNLGDPVVNRDSWRLTVSGLVTNPLTLSIEDVMSMPPVTQVTSLECISNVVGGDLIGNAVWKGIRLRDLLAKAGISDQAARVALYAADEYSDSIPVENAMDPSSVIAYEMNGEPLPAGHGFPARLLVPGIYGMKNVKWLTRIEPVAGDFLGFWQQQGWSNSAVVRTTCIIDTPDRWDVVGEPVTISGVAFSGNREISGVEISFDNGNTWHEAVLSKPESPYSWVQWSLDWRFDADGPQSITARAVDGQGVPQESQSEPPFPKGASGYHQITVTVRR